VIRVWYGTLYDHAQLPVQYATVGGTLGDTELAIGGVHMITWQPPGWGLSVQSFPLHPTTAKPRGGYGIVGLCLADILPGSSDDELIVGTMSGDLIVYAATSMQEIWRTHVPGGIGYHNSILAEDLDGNGTKELYVAGSYGLWRYIIQ
jgi:hypothetical protein